MFFRQTKERKSFGNGLTTGLKPYVMLHLLFQSSSNMEFPDIQTEFATDNKNTIIFHEFGIFEEIGIAYWKVSKTKTLWLLHEIGIGSRHLGTIPCLLLCYWTTLCYFVFTTPHGGVKRRRKTSLFLPPSLLQWLNERRKKMKSGRESFDLFTCSHFKDSSRHLKFPLYIWQLFRKEKECV